MSIRESACKACGLVTISAWDFCEECRGRIERGEMGREEALRRLRDVVHLQTVVQAWQHDRGMVEREGDPVCGASGGKMVLAEARVTCPACRERMRRPRHPR